MLLLAKTAMEPDDSGDEGRVTHVVFCTERCVPVVPLSSVSSALLSPDDTTDNNNNNNIDRSDLLLNRNFLSSYDSNSPSRTRFDEREVWDHLQPHLPYDAIRKTLPGWVLLCRRHIEDIIAFDESMAKPSGNGGGMEERGLWRVFEGVWAPEEVYLPTAPSLLGRTHEVFNRSLVHVEWDHDAADERDRAHPIVMDNVFGRELVERMREKGLLFMRKLKRGVDLGVWERFVLGGVLTTTTVGGTKGTGTGTGGGDGPSSLCGRRGRGGGGGINGGVGRFRVEMVVVVVIVSCRWECVVVVIVVEVDICPWQNMMMRLLGIGNAVS